MRRIRMPELLRGAVAAAAFRYTHTKPETAQSPGKPYYLDGEPVWQRVPLEYGRDERDLAPVLAAAARRRPRSGTPITDDELRDIADRYRAAMAEGRAPTKTIQEQFYVSRPTASRWVARARDRGFLGPARRAAAGEQPTATDESE